VPSLAVAAVLDVVFLVVAFGARTCVQIQRTGESGWRLGRPRSAVESAARGLMVASGLLLAAALLVGDGRDGLAAVAGIVVCVAAIVLVWVAQMQMGASWRIGVDPDETTELVLSRLYGVVRNPIYTGMVAFTVGQVLMVSSLTAWLAVVAMTAGVQLQVRLIEEPYLARTHGEDFARLAATAGRFVPGLGLRPGRRHPG
jgi:protein-S-isoprenylcysteine O-methyltransferase Ste14